MIYTVSSNLSDLIKITIITIIITPYTQEMTSIDQEKKEEAGFSIENCIVALVRELKKYTKKNKN